MWIIGEPSFWSLSLAYKEGNLYYNIGCEDSTHLHTTQKWIAKHLLRNTELLCVLNVGSIAKKVILWLSGGKCFTDAHKIWRKPEKNSRHCLHLCVFVREYIGFDKSLLLAMKWGRRTTRWLLSVNGASLVRNKKNEVLKTKKKKW